MFVEYKQTSALESDGETTQIEGSLPEVIEAPLLNRPQTPDLIEEAQSSMVSFTDIRPLPQVSQTTRKIRRTQQQVNRLGRTRILTDTPEINGIEQARQKQLDKMAKTKRRLHPTTDNKKPEKRKTTDVDNSVDARLFDKEVAGTRQPAAKKTKISRRRKTETQNTAPVDSLEKEVMEVHSQESQSKPPKKRTAKGKNKENERPVPVDPVEEEVIRHVAQPTAKKSKRAMETTKEDETIATEKQCEQPAIAVSLKTRIGRIVKPSVKSRENAKF